eukprot:1194610-Prorocentrum_minimum.AAC.9
MVQSAGPMVQSAGPWCSKSLAMVAMLSFCHVWAVDDLMLQDFAAATLAGAQLQGWISNSEPRR